MKNFNQTLIYREVVYTELKNDGYLNIHADFNLHPTLKLDRRLNILIYLNKNWEDTLW